MRAKGERRQPRRSSLVLVAVLALVAIGLGCGRQQAKRTSSEEPNTGTSATSPSWQQAKPLDLAGSSPLKTTPNPTREQPLVLRQILASPSVQQARKTRKEIEDFRRMIEGTQLRTYLDLLETDLSTNDA